MKKRSKPASEAQALAEYLKEAAALPQHSIRDTNPFKFLGFDRTIPRLGWVRKIDYAKVEEEMAKFLRLVRAPGKTKFLLLGIGGSINGVKVAREVFGLKAVLPWDTLDFSYYAEQEAFFRDPGAITAVGLTKSGSTDETHLIARSFQYFFNPSPKSPGGSASGVWLLDDSSLAKLYSILKEDRVRTFPLQVDKNNDIGGRFSAPNTLVFLAPLFLELEHKQIKSYWQAFLGRREETLLKAAAQALMFKHKPNAYFSIKLPVLYSGALQTWLTQLFQESFGSKKEGFGVKTIVYEEKTREIIPKEFDLVDLTGYGENPSSVFEILWYLECFVAIFSAVREINFVNQDYVEEYKRALKELSKSDCPQCPAPLDLSGVRNALRKKIPANGPFRFIEVVYFGYLSRDRQTALRRTLQEWFPEHKVFVFLGSDWNHHSYQAAFKSADTFYPILIPSEYALPQEGFPRENLQANILLLKRIACATYKTLAGKSELFCVESQSIT